MSSRRPSSARSPRHPPKQSERRLVTLGWQERVKLDLARRLRAGETPGTQEQLAVAAGCTPGAITGMLKPGAGTSKFVDAVCRVLGIPLPEFRDEREAELLVWVRIVREKDPGYFDLMMQMLEREARRLGWKG